MSVTVTELLRDRVYLCDQANIFILNLPSNTGKKLDLIQ